MKRRTFICAECEQEYPAAELSDYSLVEARVQFLKDKTREQKAIVAITRLPQEEHICRVDDTAVEEEDETPPWNYGLLFEVAFGVAPDLSDLEPAVRQRLDLNF
jgi:hypothetical protein